MDYLNTNKSSNFTQISTSVNKYVNPTQDFMNSSSLVAKISFLLFVIFGFIILLRIGISILANVLSSGGNAVLIDGMIDASQLVVIPQDPSTAGSITVYRSNNATDGIEFTWSCWIYINNLTDNAGKYKCVFYKGNDYGEVVNPNTDQQGLNFPNNAPGLYIAPNTNDLIVIMNTFNVINEQIIINDIPLNKWINVIIRCQNTTLDVYINSTITKSHQLHGVPKQNYGDVYVAMNGGFNGYISNLWYYNYALGTNAIQKLSLTGPNVKMSASASTSLGLNFPNYLSLRWFFYGANDGMN